MKYHFQYLRTIKFADTDMAGIAHFSNFFRWMEEAEHAFLQHLEIAITQRGANSDTAWVRSETRCIYCSPLRFQDELIVHLLLHKIHECIIDYEFMFYKQSQNIKKRVAHGSMSVVYAEKNRSTGRISKIPFTRDIMDAVMKVPLRSS